VLQCVAVCCIVKSHKEISKVLRTSVLQCVAVCCSLLQCVASVLQCVAVCCSVLHCEES